MSVVTTCECGNSFRIESEQVGQSVECPACGTKFLADNQEKNLQQDFGRQTIDVSSFGKTLVPPLFDEEESGTSAGNETDSTNPGSNSIDQHIEGTQPKTTAERSKLTTDHTSPLAKDLNEGAGESPNVDPTPQDTTESKSGKEPSFYSAPTTRFDGKATLPADYSTSEELSKSPPPLLEGDGPSTPQLVDSSPDIPLAPASSSQPTTNEPKANDGDTNSSVDKKALFSHLTQPRMLVIAFTLCIVHGIFAWHSFFPTLMYVFQYSFSQDATFTFSFIARLLAMFPSSILSLLAIAALLRQSWGGLGAAITSLVYFLAFGLVCIANGAHFIDQQADYQRAIEQQEEITGRAVPQNNRWIDVAEQVMMLVPKCLLLLTGPILLVGSIGVHLRTKSDQPIIKRLQSYLTLPKEIR